MWPRDAYVGQKIAVIKQPTKIKDGEYIPTLSIGSVHEITAIKADEWHSTGVAFQTDRLFGWFGSAIFRPVDPASKKADRVLASLKPSLLNPIPIRKHETVGGE